VYVSWQLGSGHGTTVVHLFADEPSQASDDLDLI
jgi:hypothetical protein